MTDDREWLAERFEADRGRLRAVAYRMLGSLAEAEDAVQEAWLRLARSDADVIENLSGWLTTVVGRICLDMLRSRTSRREESLDAHIPDPVVEPADASDPEAAAVLADSVGLAMLVVLDTLSPAERVAFVLHDTFGVPFDAIAAVLDRSTDATKMLASRARSRLRNNSLTPDADPRRQRAVVDAFLAAAREGDFEGLLNVLAPDVLLRADAGDHPLSGLVRGAAAVASRASMFRRTVGDAVVTPVLVNGLPGLFSTVEGKPFSLLAFTVVDERIVAIDALADRERLASLSSTWSLPAP
ncbi:MAG TPA: sigma-70 family RNA polymerase sigma factor [Jatrophihabitantaceae bacterium]|nr:sigma-70 family RNA polymerase sigma factor [Jatrophihabitantaceae bacterium]